MPFRTALSGLNAASADLRVTGNNVANAGTTGFKESRAEFADVFALSSGSISKTAVGTGTRLSSVTQQFRQGNIDFTGNNMDLALSGKGMFALSDGGSRVYSREGAFQVDRDGYVINAGGQRLQAYEPVDPFGESFNTGTLNDLQLDTTESPPQGTSNVEAVFNLSADAEDLSAAPFAVDDPASYSFSRSLSVFDSLGQTHDASLYFRNVGGVNWEANLSVDGQAVGGAQPLSFDASGQLQNPGGPVSFGAFAPGNGAEPLDIEFDFSGATQFGNESSVGTLRQDGFSSGRLTGVDIDETGVVFARFTNGQAQSLGKVAVVQFPNPQGLQQLGDNAWAQSFAAGDPLYGEAGQSDFGSIQAGGLEASNVDIAEQLVGLITAQRNYQANAQVISTADAVTQTIINIR